MDLNSILAYLFGLIVLFIAGWLLIVPLKILWKLIYNSVLGALVLLVLNFLGTHFGISIGINPLTALICGFLGVPGIILMLVAKYIVL